MSDDDGSFFGDDPITDHRVPDDDEEQGEDIPDADVDLDGGPEGVTSVEDLGLRKGLTLWLKDIMGKDIGDYEHLLADGDDVTKGEQQKDLIAPSGADFSNPTMSHVGQQYQISSFTSEFPFEPQNLFLRRVFGRPEAESDIAIHLSPYDNNDAVRFLRKQVENLEADFKLSQDAVDMTRQERRYAAARRMLETIQNESAELFDISMYTTARGGTEDAANDAWNRMKAKLTQSPALTDQVIATYVQDKAMKTTSPIGKDFIGYKRQALSGAVAAALPMTSTVVNEQTGVNFGLHGYNMSPVFIDRFDRPGGYNQLTIGNIGSGKSFSTKLNILREYNARDDVMVIMLDPLEGFKNFANLLNGEHIVVGGERGINPLEIQPPNNVERAREEDIDPFAAAVDKASTFFQTFFNQEDIHLGDKISTLETAIKKTYHKAGITRDIDTHSKPSPTVRDLFETLQEISDNPGEYAYADTTDAKSDVETEADILRQHANQLLSDMSAFREGEKYEMLAEETQVDIRGNDLVYLDLQSNEMDEDTGLMMQLLFNAVYERSKQTDKKVIFAIDEAHVMMQDPETLSLLARAVRHSRHYEMSINFITQTAEEFYETEYAKTIADNCTIKLIHKTQGLSDEAAEALGMNQLQRERARNLLSGKQNSATVLGGSGFSEGLLYVDPIGWLPLRVVPSPVEAEIVDADTQDQQAMLRRLIQIDTTQ